MNDNQIKYLAESLKIAGIAQLAGIGFFALREDPINIGLAGGSLAIGVWMIEVGREMLGDLKKPDDYDE